MDRRSGSAPCQSCGLRARCVMRPRHASRGWTGARGYPGRSMLRVSRVLRHWTSPARSSCESQSTAARAADRTAAIVSDGPLSAAPPPPPRSPTGVDVVEWTVGAGAPRCGPSHRVSRRAHGWNPATAWRPRRTGLSHRGAPARGRADRERICPQRRRRGFPPIVDARRPGEARHPSTAGVRRHGVGNQRVSAADRGWGTAAPRTPRPETSACAVSDPGASEAIITTTNASPSPHAARPRMRPSSRMRPPPCDSTCTATIVSRGLRMRKEKFGPNSSPNRAL